MIFENLIEHETVFSLSNFVWNISHTKKNSGRYCHKCTYVGLHMQYLLFMTDFTQTWIFSTDFWKILKYQISFKKTIQ